jgi:hypothetical protein
MRTSKDNWYRWFAALMQRVVTAHFHKCLLAKRLCLFQPQIQILSRWRCHSALASDDSRQSNESGFTSYVPLINPD